MTTKRSNLNELIKKKLMSNTALIGVLISSLLFCNGVYATKNEQELAQKQMVQPRLIEQRVQVGKIIQWVTRKGMKVLYQQAPSLPMIDFRLIFDAGAARDSEFISDNGQVLAGLAKLTNGLIFEGTDTLSANQIAEQFASLGVNYSHGSYRDMAVVNLRTLSYAKQRDPALALFSQILTYTRFPEEALQREIARMLVALEYADQTPSKKASRAFYQSLYPKHPYGTPPEGNRKSLKLIQQKELMAYYQQFYVNKNAVLAIVGNLTEAQAHQYADKISAALPIGTKVAVLPDAKQDTQARLIKQNHSSTQTTVLMGQPVLQRGDHDLYALSVGNHILGASGFSSRLMKEVRVKRGLTYSIGSYLVAMRVQGPYQFSFTTKQSSTEEAIQLVTNNIRKFREKGPTEEELINAKLNITGSFPLRQASNKDIVENLAVIGFYQLPLDYLASYNRHIEAVTIEQIKSAYQRRVHPNKMTTIIIGPDVETMNIKDEG
jgi:zinc protease